MSSAGIAIAWRPRDVPLEPRAVLGQGEVARALAQKLLARDDEALAKLSGLAAARESNSTTLILVLGPAAELPWIDGVLYLGQDPAAPSLLLPTALAPDLPAALVERALLARFPDLAPPVAVLPDPPRIVGAGIARPLLRRELARLGG